MESKLVKPDRLKLRATKKSLQVSTGSGVFDCGTYKKTIDLILSSIVLLKNNLGQYLIARIDYEMHGYKQERAKGNALGR